MLVRVRNCSTDQGPRRNANTFCRRPALAGVELLPKQHRTFNLDLFSNADLETLAKHIENWNLCATSASGSVVITPDALRAMKKPKPVTQPKPVEVQQAPIVIPVPVAPEATVPKEAEPEPEPVLTADVVEQVPPAVELEVAEVTPEVQDVEHHVDVPVDVPVGGRDVSDQMRIEDIVDIPKEEDIGSGYTREELSKMTNKELKSILIGYHVYVHNKPKQVLIELIIEQQKRY